MALGGVGDGCLEVGLWGCMYGVYLQRIELAGAMDSAPLNDVAMDVGAYCTTLNMVYTRVYE